MMRRDVSTMSMNLFLKNVELEHLDTLVWGIVNKNFLITVTGENCSEKNIWSLTRKIFRLFVPGSAETTYQHSVTVVGYSTDRFVLVNSL